MAQDKQCAKPSAEAEQNITHTTQRFHWHSAPASAQAEIQAPAGIPQHRFP